MLPKSIRRKFIAMFAPSLLKGLLHILWSSCRVKAIIGDEHADAIISSAKPAIPCYWHQHHIFGIYYMLELRKRGLNVGFLISPSRDGEIPSKIAESWGIKAIRGSSNRTGARALRDLFQIICKEGISPLNTSDGPTGPLHKFKPGSLMLSQMTGAPILPISYVASRYWQLKSWDQFIIPKPFSRIVIAVAEPRYIDKGISLEELTLVQEEMETIFAKLEQQAIEALKE